MDKVERKFRIWEGLVDSSIYFALAGLRAQGFRKNFLRSRLKKRWERALAEHHQTNLSIARRFYGQRGDCKTYWMRKEGGELASTQVALLGGACRGCQEASLNT